MITIGEYTKLFLTVIVGLGLIFEMPVLVFFLALMRVVTARWMCRNLRYSILAIFVLAAIITPTTDILNMCLFAAPMVGLYGISIGVAWLVNPGPGQVLCSLVALQFRLMQEFGASATTRLRPRDGRREPSIPKLRSARTEITRQPRQLSDNQFTTDPYQNRAR
jgi:hypothetical protein